MIRNCNETCEINVQSGNTDNCHFLMQKEWKTKDCRAEGKNKAELTVVPLTGNRMQTRQNRSKRISPGKEVEMLARRKKEKG